MPTKKKKPTTKKPDWPTSTVPPLTQEIIAKHSSTACSIEFGRDSKGQPKWNLKISCERGDMEDVLEEILRLDAEIQKQLEGGEEE